MAHKFDWVIDLLKQAHEFGYRSAIAGLTLAESQQMHETAIVSAVEALEKTLAKQKENKDE